VLKTQCLGEIIEVLLTKTVISANQKRKEGEEENVATRSFSNWRWINPIKARIHQQDRCRCRDTPALHRRGETIRKVSPSASPFSPVQLAAVAGAPTQPRQISLYATQAAFEIRNSFPFRHDRLLSIETATV
jgi:hypothetical protein